MLFRGCTWVCPQGLEPLGLTGRRQYDFKYSEKRPLQQIFLRVKRHVGGGNAWGHVSRDGYEIQISESSEYPDIQIRIWIKLLSELSALSGLSGFMDLLFMRITFILNLW